jgi:hypothetical protein
LSFTSSQEYFPYKSSVTGSYEQCYEFGHVFRSEVR